LENHFPDDAASNAGVACHFRAVSPNLFLAHWAKIALPVIRMRISADTLQKKGNYLLGGIESLYCHCMF